MLEVIREQEVLDKAFRVFGTWENPLFLAKDVAEWIEHSNSRAMLKGLDEEDKVKLTVDVGCKESLHTSSCGSSHGGLRDGTEMWFLTEQGVYEVLMQSRKPIAKEFKKQVKAILKEIRTTGYYSASSTMEEKTASLVTLENMMNLAEGLKEEHRKNNLLLQENKSMATYIEEAKPKVKFAEAVEQADNTISVAELAKLIYQNGVEIGQQRLYQWFRDQGYVIKREGTGKNIPTQLAMEMGLFKINERVHLLEDGHSVISKTTRVTGRGQVYFMKKLLTTNELAITGSKLTIGEDLVCL